MKGKIPIITRCAHCQFKYRLGADRKCGFTHKVIPHWYMDEIPDWCPLPDADKLLALLEGEEERYDPANGSQD